MILLDYSQVVIGSFMSVSKGQGVVEENMLRHVILNTIRQFRNQFLDDYAYINKFLGEVEVWPRQSENVQGEIEPQVIVNGKIYKPID